MRAALAELPKELTQLDAGALQDKRVLVVDDHHVNVRVLMRQLRQWGMRVASAASGAAALDVLDQSLLPDVIITDMHMPGMDGLELAKHIRKRPGSENLPLILLSSGFMPGGASASPFNACLLKPARQNQLFDALARCLSSDTMLRSIKAERVDVKKNVTVLVANNNVVNLKVACGILTRLGYDSVTAADGVQAVTAVADSMNSGRRFGAILMDLHMPGMNGLEATQTIKKRFGLAAPPIIALTADASIEDRERCEAAGMDDCLTKPLQVVELTRSLARWAETAALEPGKLAASALPAYSASPAQGAVDFARLEEFREFDPDLETAQSR